VQDAAAALPAKVLLAALGGDIRARTVADLCAAPGGKTAQLAAAGARVIAVDRSKRRLNTLRENLARLDLAAEIVTADVAHWRPATPPAAVLLDAPCTATGTIRRHPDVPGNKTPDEVARMAALQTDLIAAAADLLPAGGVLVYSVCSLQPEEGPAIVGSLLAGRDDFARLPIAAGETGVPDEAITPDGDMRTLPCHLAEAGGMDGFYVARLRRRG
jgi:16S rRNA (cytosine967-C5)-methyltransferase